MFRQNFYFFLFLEDYLKNSNLIAVAIGSYSPTKILGLRHKRWSNNSYLLIFRCFDGLLYWLFLFFLIFCPTLSFKVIMQVNFCTSHRNIFKPSVWPMSNSITFTITSNTKLELFSILLILNVLFILSYFELGKSTVAIIVPYYWRKTGFRHQSEPVRQNPRRNMPKAAAFVENF